MNKMRNSFRRILNKISSAFLVGILIFGLCLIAYPTLSDWYNSFHSSKAVSYYENKVEKIDSSEINRIRQTVIEYNQNLYKHPRNFVGGDVQDKEYEKILNLDDNGMMGHIDIHRVGISLPIYHGTSDDVLAVGAGHLEGSSIPGGGNNTHSILMGHRGLSTAKLFDDIVKLKKGDIFTLTILDDALTYKVDQIRIVKPDDIHELEIEPDRDYVTLITCTPYAVNTDRLLVRGTRVDRAYGSLTNVTEIHWIWSTIVILFLLFLGARLISSIKMILDKRKGRI